MNMPNFIGRESDLSHIDEQFFHVVTSQARVLLIEGIAGGSVAIPLGVTPSCLAQGPATGSRGYIINDQRWFENVFNRQAGSGQDEVYSSSND